MASSTEPSGPAQSSLAGSINLATGVFQHSVNDVEHPRLRTAHACETCRIRKVKCSGGNPCERCLARRLQCEYAPARKVRGPNRNRRIAAVLPKRSEASSPTSDRAIPHPASTPASSNSSGAVLSHPQRSEWSPSTPGSYSTVGISSTQSSPTPAHRAAPETSRPRSAGVGQNPSGRTCNVLDAFPMARAGLPKRRPPPRPLVSSKARERYSPPFSVPIDASMNNRLPLLAQSSSRIALHSSDTARGLFAAPDSRAVSQGASRFRHQSPVSAVPSWFLPTKGHPTSNSPDMSTPATPPSLAYGVAGGKASAVHNGPDTSGVSSVLGKRVRRNDGCSAGREGGPGLVG